MKKLILSLAAFAISTTVFAENTADNNPVLMTVNGRDVKVNEFLYLYNKNNTQQLQPQSVEDYVDMFVDYKLKVADAENAGIDTTAAFIAEFDKYRTELAAPYLRDNNVENKLLHEAYSHMGKELKVSHIMIPVNRSLNVDKKANALIDSIRTSILDGKISFEEAAEKYSADRPTAQKGGLMGWMPAGRFPWAFEKAAYDTPVGSISPVIDSGFGLHIIKVEDQREPRGEVWAAHILKLTRDMPAEKVQAQKQAIDSIYQVLLNGADFAEVATAESQDPGSAKRGGDLGWFGSGVMVAPFDSIAFALADGEISEPFATDFGYHIIKRFDHKGVPSFEDARQQLMMSMSRDERIDRPRKVRLEELANKYGYIKLKANTMALRHRLSMLPLDSTTFAALAEDTIPLVRLGDSAIRVSDAFAKLTSNNFPNSVALAEAIDHSADQLFEDVIVERAVNELAEENTEYSNLINEYRDGILLFEISNRNVWDRAAKDKKGLEKFFHDNAKRYAWDSPRFKGYVIFAPNDSILNEAISYADSINIEDPEEFVSAMRKQFVKNLKIERVIAAKGENPITDYLAFGGEKPEVKSTKWTSYVAYRGQIIDKPREAADVKGQATTDYQALLEKQWLKQLHKRYPVNIDKKVLKSISANK